MESGSTSRRSDRVIHLHGLPPPETRQPTRVYRRSIIDATTALADPYATERSPGDQSPSWRRLLAAPTVRHTSASGDARSAEIRQLEGTYVVAVSAKINATMARSVSTPETDGYRSISTEPSAMNLTSQRHPGRETSSITESGRV